MPRDLVFFDKFADWAVHTIYEKIPLESYATWKEKLNITVLIKIIACGSIFMNDKLKLVLSSVSEIHKNIGVFSSGLNPPIVERCKRLLDFLGEFL